MKAWIVAVVAAAGVSVAVAAPASADDSAYLSALQNDTYLVSTYSDQELLNEGHKVCDAVSSGGQELDAIEMVEHDLSVSHAAAIDVYNAATVTLGC
jgi:uncharacterized membrane protein